MASSASRRMAHATHATQRWGEVSFSRTLFPPPSHLIIPPCQIITCKMTIVIVNSKTFDNDPISTCRLATREGERHELRIDYSAHYRPPPDSCSWLAPSCQGWRPYVLRAKKKKPPRQRKEEKTAPSGQPCEDGDPGHSQENQENQQTRTRQKNHHTRPRARATPRIACPPGVGRVADFYCPAGFPAQPRRSGTSRLAPGQWPPVNNNFNSNSPTRQIISGQKRTPGPGLAGLLASPAYCTQS